MVLLFIFSFFVLFCYTYFVFLYFFFVYLFFHFLSSFVFLPVQFLCFFSIFLFKNYLYFSFTHLYHHLSVTLLPINYSTSQAHVTKRVFLSWKYFPFFYLHTHLYHYLSTSLASYISLHLLTSCRGAIFLTLFSYRVPFYMVYLLVAEAATYFTWESLLNIKWKLSSMWLTLLEHECSSNSRVSEKEDREGRVLSECSWILWRSLWFIATTFQAHQVVTFVRTSRRDSKKKKKKKKRKKKKEKFQTKTKQKKNLLMSGLKWGREYMGTRAVDTYLHT